LPSRSTQPRTARNCRRRSSGRAARSHPLLQSSRPMRTAPFRSRPAPASSRRPFPSRPRSQVHRRCPEVRSRRGPNLRCPRRRSRRRLRLHLHRLSPHLPRRSPHSRHRPAPARKRRSASARPKLRWSVVLLASAVSLIDVRING
jgi:hypothetical protein